MDAPFAAPGTDRINKVVALVAAVIDEGLTGGASDIHLDPVPEGLRVRMRVDGLLAERRTLPAEVRLETIARIKILAGLRSDEHHAAQDGRFHHESQAGSADIRVSIVPTYHGENAVLRLLPSAGRALSLDELGFTDTDARSIEAFGDRPKGLLLVTGPTGSGKTTTLYALIGRLDAASTSIVAIEDPIEYAIAGVRQIPVREKAGLSFATGLRAMLRQDPDAIMVGEIRDSETARLAVNAGLTGHLVLSTLHTTDAATAIPRLLDMGVEPYLLASTLSLIIAQRLARRLCACATECEMPRAFATRMPPGTQGVWREPSGCTACNQTGYRRRMALYEMLTVTDAMRDAMLARAPAERFRTLGREAGMTSMHENGIAAAARGITTLAEAFRVLHD